jgi:hypothetical protein
MNYLGMNKKEFLVYTIKMVNICIEIQLEEKEWLKKHGGGTNYDQ